MVKLAKKMLSLSINDFVHSTPNLQRRVKWEHLGIYGKAWIIDVDIMIIIYILTNYIEIATHINFKCN